MLQTAEKRRFALLASADVLVSVLDILFLAGLLWIVNGYLQPATLHSDWIPSGLLQHPLALAGLYFFLYCVKNWAGYELTRAEYRFNGRVAVRLSEANLFRYQAGSFQDFIRVDSSVWLRRIGFQPFEFCQFILSGFQQLITQGCLILLSVLAILLFQAKLFLLLLVLLLPPAAAVFSWIKKRLTLTRQQIRTTNEYSYQYLLDALKGYVEGNLYQKNEFFRERFLRYRRKFSIHIFDSIGLQVLPSRVIELFAVLGLIVLMILADWTGRQNGDAFLTVGAFAAAAYKIIPGLVKLINTAGQMRAFESALHELGGEGGPQECETFQESIARLDAWDLGFGYGGNCLFTGLKFSVQAGQMVGISGRSGRGKTTLFHLLLGFLTPSSGGLRINGRCIDAKGLQGLWGRISYVRQQAFLLHDTLERNITLEEIVSDRNRLDDVVEAAGLCDLVRTVPEGLQHIITENGKNISGGQQQRIALARALYKPADLYLLDEPFNELDTASTTRLLAHFRSLAASGALVLLISHDPQCLSFCDALISWDENE